MPESRSQKHHRERLSEALRDEITAILEGELADPRIGPATVSEVLLAADGRSARILIAVEGDDDDSRQTMKGLAAARGFIRHQMSERLGLRHPPELTFQLDRSRQYRDRIDQLLDRMHRRRS